MRDCEEWLEQKVAEYKKAHNKSSSTAMNNAELSLVLENFFDDWKHITEGIKRFYLTGE